MSAPLSAAEDDADWLVACLCAAWCRTCDDYRPTFEALARTRPGLRFSWIDIEDQSDALGPVALDLDNFPTLLVARGDEVRFFGTVLPHADTLARTIDAARRSVLTPPVPGLEPERVAALHTVGDTVR